MRTCQSRASGTGGVGRGAYLDDHDELSGMLRMFNSLEWGNGDGARLTCLYTSRGDEGVVRGRFLWSVLCFVGSGLGGVREGQAK